MEDKIVKANTGSDNVEDINFCFKVSKVYEPDCLIGNLLCEQKCGGEPKEYKGSVIMTDDTQTEGGSGSGTSISATAPLRFVVSCVEYERDWSPAYIAGIVIVLIILGILFYKKYSTPILIRDEDKLKRLEEKVQKEKGKK